MLCRCCSLRRILRKAAKLAKHRYYFLKMVVFRPSGFYPLISETFIHETTNDIRKAMSTVSCPKCGEQAPFGTLFCPNCGTYLTQPQPTTQPVMSQRKINTHTYCWIILALLVSLLWFKLDGRLMFPLGFVGGLVITYFSWHIDKQVGKQALAYTGFIFSFIGMILGAAIN